MAARWFAQPGSNPAIPLVPESSTSFFAVSPDLQVTFQPAHGRAASLVWRVNGDVTNAPRLP